MCQAKIQFAAMNWAPSLGNFPQKRRSSSQPPAPTAGLDALRTRRCATRAPADLSRSAQLAQRPLAGARPARRYSAGARGGRPDLHTTVPGSQQTTANDVNGAGLFLLVVG